jgi:hypothetical protein
MPFSRLTMQIVLLNFRAKSGIVGSIVKAVMHIYVSLISSIQDTMI